MKKYQKYQKAFTLIEILIVIGLIAVLSTITIVAINPLKHFQDARNNERRSEITTLWNAINQWEIDQSPDKPSGSLSTLLTNFGSEILACPPELSATIGSNAVMISSQSPNSDTFPHRLNLQPILVSGVKSYISELPVGPLNTSIQSTLTSGDTKYFICSDEDSIKYTIYTPAEPSGFISETR